MDASLIKECLRNRKKICRYFEIVSGESQILLDLAKLIPNDHPEMTRIGRFFDAILDVHDECMNDFTYAKRNKLFGEKLRDKTEWVIYEGEHAAYEERRKQQKALERGGFEELAKDIMLRHIEEPSWDESIRKAIEKDSDDNYEQR